MKQRLLEMIGSDARKVVIKTFHSLGAEIMNSNPDEFWNAARLEASPEAVKLETITNIVSQLPLDNPLALKFSGQYTLVSEILKAISKAKEAGLTYKNYRNCNANLQYIDSIEHLLHPLVDDRVSKKQISLYKELATKLPESTHDKLTAPIPSLAKIFRSSIEKAIRESEASETTTPFSEWKKQWLETIHGVKKLKDQKKNQWWRHLAHLQTISRTNAF